MIRFFLLRIVLPLILLLVLRSLLVSVWRLFSQFGSTVQKQAPGVKTGGELKKDPVCGTFVSAAGSVTKTVNGEVIHFCSAACRDKFRVV